MCTRQGGHSQSGGRGFDATALIHLHPEGRRSNEFGDGVHGRQSGDAGELPGVWATHGKLLTPTLHPEGGELFSRVMDVEAMSIPSLV